MTLPTDPKGDDMSKIPDDVMEAAKVEAAFYRAWLDAGNSTGSLSDHATDGLADSIAHAIMAERERAAALVDAEAARILSLQDGKNWDVDQNLRMIAVLLPDLSAAIRATP